MVDLCIDARMLYSSGIGTYLRELLVYVLPEYKTVLLGNKSELDDFLKDNDLQAEIIEFEPGIYSISEQVRYSSVIPECNVFWSPHYNIPLFPIKAKKRLTTIHDLNHIALKKSLSLIEQFYAKFVMRRAIKSADRIITVSGFSALEIEKYYNETKKVTMIYNGVNADSFVAASVSENYKLPENYILYVGNIKPHKNIKGLIRSFNIYKNKYKTDLSLVIVGKKEGLINSEDLEYDKNVVFIENVDFSDLIKIYRGAEIFLFLSFYEGFGLPILEAQASGIPVICSNSSSLTEVSNGSCIELDPDSHDEVADSINTLMIDNVLYRYYVKQGMENIKKFSWNKSGKKHLQVIENLIQGDLK